MRSVQREVYLYIRENIYHHFMAARQSEWQACETWLPSSKAFNEIWCQVSDQVREPTSHLAFVMSDVAAGLYHATWRDTEEIRLNIKRSQTLPGMIVNRLKSFKKKYLG